MIDKSNMLLCWKCKKLVPYTIYERNRIRNCNGIEVRYIEQYARCNDCHEEIWVPGLDDQNEDACKEAYLKQKGAAS